MNREELIRMLQAAKEGSDDLDHDILTTLRKPADYDAEGNFGGNHILPSYQRFTRSVDAALRLVRDGYALDHLCEHYRIQDGLLKVGGPDGVTCKLAYDNKGVIGKVQAVAATLPLAICIAAMVAEAE